LRWPLDQFRTQLGAEGNRIALEIIEAEEKKSGPAKTTTDERLKIIQQQRDPMKMLAAIEKAVVDHPKITAYKNRLASQYSSLGRAVDALLLIEKLLEKEPKNKAYTTRLVTGWKRMRNPERAKRFEEQKKAAPKQAEATQKVPAANVVEIHKAVLAKRMDAARRLWRRLWRDFQLKPSPYPVFGNWRLNNLLMQRWPREQAKATKLYRGGIPVETKEEAKVELPQPAVLALSEYDFGAAELARQVRTLGVGELDRASVLFDGLAGAAVRTKGRAAAIAETAAKLRSGDARKADSALLLKLLEGEPNPGAELRALLVEIIGAVNVYDYETARRLARVHARTGALAQAAVLYRWCVTQLHASNDYWNRPDTRKLVEECAEQLKGDDRIEIVELILKSSRPTLQRSFNRDGQDAVEIRTWEKVLGAKEALTKTRALCEKAAGRPSPVRRQSARAASILLAAGGEYELALRALVNGIGRLDPATVERPQSIYIYYNAYQFLPQPLSSNEMLRLFPVGASKQWCEAAADALSEWIASGILEPRSATRLQALVAVRLHAAGESDAARWLAGEAEKRSQGDPATRVWVMDAWRALGDAAKADAMERALLDARCLPLARIPEALARLDEAEREAARAKVAEYTTLN
jgi:hypothetical protein